MDGHRFDDLTKTLAFGTSRRRVVKQLIGGLAGGLLAVVAGDRTDAYVCRQRGATCLKDAQCCSDTCDRSTYRCACPQDQVPCGPGCCAAGQVCRSDGTCCTPRGCAAQGKNCGTIGDGCGGTPSCGSCSSGQTCCSNHCTELGADFANCGSCGHACPFIAGAECQQGICCQTGIQGDYSCSATLPCCLGTCQGGKCCLPSGSTYLSCSTFGSDICCSGQCAANGFCA